jgi:2-desacetyl-2-hydroxyethyl bacteriochlorophyllide A dehydrogenase
VPLTKGPGTLTVSSNPMKAFALHAPRQLVLGDLAIPSIASGEVLIRVSHTGVCGTDGKIFNGTIPVTYPLIMGHEVVGEIVEPAAIADFRRGDKVIIDPMLSCGSCFHCRVAQTNLCPRGVLLGRDQNGGFAEYISVPVKNVFALSPSIDVQTAPLIQVATTCLHGHRVAALFPGESAVILGLGVTGQLHIQLAKARGAHPIIGVSRSPLKRKLAGELGADITFASGEGLVNQVLDATGGRGADLVIESTGNLHSLTSAIEVARVGGRVLLFGITTDQEGALPFYELYFKELTIYNSRAAKGEDFPAVIEFVRRGVLQLKPLLTHVFPFSELNSALDLLDLPAEDRLKVIVEH